VDRSVPPIAPAADAMDVLELGCGTGNDAARLAREGFTSSPPICPLRHGSPTFGGCSARGVVPFHVNAYGVAHCGSARPIVRELEPDYVLEEAGQTVRFFF
jgi:hypothetical protein